MKKPVLEWLNELPEPHRTQAIAQNKSVQLADNLKDAVSLFREWMDTEEGWTYWNDLHTELKREKTKTIPEQLSEVEKLWPRNIRETRLWAEHGEWTAEYGGETFYGSTPMEAYKKLAEAFMGWAKDNGSDASVWGPVIEFLKQEKP